VCVASDRADTTVANQRLDGLVPLGSHQTNHFVGEPIILVDRNHLRGISGAHSHDADVVLGPQLTRAQLSERLVDHARRVVLLSCDVRLVDEEKDVLEVPVSAQTTQTRADLRDPAAVVDVVADVDGEALLGLLAPLVVTHAREHEHPVGTDIGLVVHDDAGQSGHHTRLAGLHRRRQVDPHLLDMVQVQVTQEGCQRLGPMQSRKLVKLVRVQTPARSIQVGLLLANVGLDVIGGDRSHQCRCDSDERCVHLISCVALWPTVAHTDPFFGAEPLFCFLFSNEDTY